MALFRTKVGSTELEDKAQSLVRQFWKQLVGVWWLPLGAVIVHAGAPSGAEPVAEVRGTPMGVDSPLSWVRENPHRDSQIQRLAIRNAEYGFAIRNVESELELRIGIRRQGHDSPQPCVLAINITISSSYVRVTTISSSLLRGLGSRLC